MRPPSRRRQLGYLGPAPFFSNTYKVAAADFDGANDFMTRGAALSGIASSKTGILSLWVRFDGGDGVQQRLLSSTGGGVPIFLEKTAANQLDIRCRNAAGFDIVSIVSTASYTAGATWRHVLLSWDCATSAEHFYVTDVNVLAGGVISNDTVNYAGATNWAVAAATAGTAKLNGCLADFYFAPGQFLDFSVVANRRKFITSNRRPQYLGPTGAFPTGVAPILYNRLSKTDVAASFATDRSGSGNTLTITGALDIASSSPSD